MGFWDAYRASLKSPEVEEPIDFWLHRPLGYIIARLSYPTPLTPDAITIGSILLGWAAGACLFASFPQHRLVGALLILASTAFDCADGQLARMRKSSSVFGRMIDGSADTLVLLAVVPATAYRVWQKHNDPSWLGFTVLGLTVLTVITSGWHTLAFDFYKNAWMRFTTDGYKEGETLEEAKARHAQVASTLGPILRMTYWLYFIQIKSQQDVVRMVDPAMSFGKLPERSVEAEEAYRRLNSLPWGLNRRLFGVGSLMFGLALSNALDLADVYLLFRLVVLNVVFFLVYRPLQRRATDAFFARGFVRGA
jgi:phosphatidylglycerophosphate synthase